MSFKIWKNRSLLKVTSVLSLELLLVILWERVLYSLLLYLYKSGLRRSGSELSRQWQSFKSQLCVPITYWNLQLLKHALNCDNASAENPIKLLIFQKSILAEVNLVIWALIFLFWRSRQFSFKENTVSHLSDFLITQRYILLPNPLF